MISKASHEWPDTKEWLLAEIAKAHLDLEGDMLETAAARTRGRISAFREIISRVEDVLPDIAPLGY